MAAQIMIGELPMAILFQPISNTHSLWIKEERNSCQDVQCLRKTYKDRIDQLNSYSDDTGTWKGTYIHNNAQLIIEKDLNFEYSAVGRGANTCYVEGEFSQRRDTLVYKEDGCSLQIKSINNRTLNIKVDGCSGMCGVQAWMIDGKFKK